MRLLALPPLLSLLLLLLLGRGSVAPYFRSPYNLSPRTRTLAPLAIWRSSGASVEAAGGAVLPLTLKGRGAYAVLDFGKEVAGITTLKFGATAKGSVGLAYSESNFFAACPAGPCDKGHVSGGGCAGLRAAKLPVAVCRRPVPRRVPRLGARAYPHSRLVGPAVSLLVVLAPRAGSAGPVW